MKYLKGCLVIFIGFLIIFTGIYFFYKNSVISNLKTRSEEVQLNWKNFEECFRNRNSELKQKNIQNDSLTYFINISEKLKSTEFTTELEFNEYKINQNLIFEQVGKEFDDKLNNYVDKYNQSVREYNTYRGIFPNFIIAKREKIKRHYGYFDIIKYGTENENPKKRRKKIADWIKYGGDYPE